MNPYTFQYVLQNPLYQSIQEMALAINNDMMNLSQSELVVMMQKMQMEMEALKKKSAPKPKGVWFKVSEKGAVSVYGLQQYPVTLYTNQWRVLLDKRDELIQFLDEHSDELSVKPEKAKKETKKEKNVKTAAKTSSSDEA